MKVGESRDEFRGDLDYEGHIGQVRRVTTLVPERIQAIAFVRMRGASEHREVLSWA